MSITFPTGKAGVVGLKPTPGLTSWFGVIQTNAFQDTLGPLTSCVRDAAILLEVMAGRVLLSMRSKLLLTRGRL